MENFILEDLNEHKQTERDSILEQSKEDVNHAIVIELQALVLGLNKTGMEQLGNKQTQEARQTLLYAKEKLELVEDVVLSVTNINQMLTKSLLEMRNSLFGLTFNNLGCVAKQALNFEEALEFTMKALHYESTLKNSATNNSEGTILNICSILSKLGQQATLSQIFSHQQAYKYARQAIVRLNSSMQTITELSDHIAQENQQAVQSLAATTVIAHFNAAVELEFMSLWKEAKDEYETTAQLAKLSLPAENPIHQKIAKALQKVRMQVRNKVQQAPTIQQPFIHRVESNEIVHNQPAKTLLWQPKFKPKPIKQQGELQLGDILSQIKDQCLKKREPRHTHGQSLNASLQAQRPANQNLRRSRQFNSTMVNTTMSSIPAPATLQVDDTFEMSTLPSILNASFQSKQRQKTAADKTHKLRQVNLQPRILSTQRDSRRTFAFTSIISARDEIFSRVQERKSIANRSIDLDKRPFAVNPMRISLQTTSWKDELFAPSDLQSLTCKSKEAKTYLTKNFGLPQEKLPMDRLLTIRKPHITTSVTLRQDNHSLEQAYYKSIDQFKAENAQEIRTSNSFLLEFDNKTEKCKLRTNAADIEISTQSFELKSPKTAISRLRLEEPITSPKGKESLELIKRNQDKLKKIQSDFLQLSPKQQLKLVSQSSDYKTKENKVQSPKREEVKSKLSERVLKHKKETPRITPEQSPEPPMKFPEPQDKQKLSGVTKKAISRDISEESSLHVIKQKESSKPFLNSKESPKPEVKSKLPVVFSQPKKETSKQISEQSPKPAKKSKESPKPEKKFKLPDVKQDADKKGPSNAQTDPKRVSTEDIIQVNEIQHEEASPKRTSVVSRKSGPKKDEPIATPRADLKAVSLMDKSKADVKVITKGEEPRKVETKKQEPKKVEPSKKQSVLNPVKQTPREISEQSPKPEVKNKLPVVVPQPKKDTKISEQSPRPGIKPKESDVKSKQSPAPAVKQKPEIKSKLSKEVSQPKSNTSQQKTEQSPMKSKDSILSPGTDSKSKLSQVLLKPNAETQRQSQSITEEQEQPSTFLQKAMILENQSPHNEPANKASPEQVQQSEFFTTEIVRQLQENPPYYSVQPNVEIQIKEQSNVLKHEEKSFKNGGFVIQHSQFRNLSQDGSASGRSDSRSQSWQRNTLQDGVPRLIIRKNNAIQIASIDLSLAASLEDPYRAQNISVDLNHSPQNPRRYVSQDYNPANPIRYVSQDYAPNQAVTLKHQGGFLFGRQNPIQTPDPILGPIQTPDPIPNNYNVAALQQSQDSMNSIANKIHGLNLHIDKFKAQLEQQRDDPLLASSRRNTPELQGNSSALRKKRRVNQHTDSNSLRSVLSTVK